MHPQVFTNKEMRLRWFCAMQVPLTKKPPRWDQAQVTHILKVTKVQVELVVLSSRPAATKNSEAETR